MKTGILATLLISLLILATAGAIWASGEFQQLEDVHMQRKDTFIQASYE